MSEVKLNIIDNQLILSGTIHGSIADRCVAALSAEPETIDELISALARYNKPLDNHSPFATFRAAVSNSGNIPLDSEPWDAGIVVIDMAARIVSAESTYSCPGPSGQVSYHDGTAATDVDISYRLPDDWLFVNSVEAYRWSRERRKAERKPPIDVRKVLYGAPLIAFIKEECGKIEISEKSVNGNGTDSSAPDPEAALSPQLSAIHARWLTTPRADLGGRSPRDVILDKRELIDLDLDSRSLQWSLLDEGPPCLATDSFAYRFAGFGTHEWVIYYDLVRHLLWCATDIVRQTSVCRSIEGAQSEGQTKALVEDDSWFNRLEKLKTDWLEEPHPDYDGRVPAILIDNERKRLPIAMRPRDMIIDEHCPVCQMFGDETTPLGMGVGFWHLDGSSMDDEFAFSSCKTREEWEAENRRREEFDKEFDRRLDERKQRLARGEPLERDSFFDADPFPELEFEDSSLLTDKSSSDDKEFPH